MSSITKPILLNETGLLLAEKLDKIAAVIASGSTYDFSSMAKITNLVRSGLAPEVLPIGSQIVTTWTDTATNTSYSMPFNVAHFENVTLESGDVVPGMFLHSNYATPFGVQFDNFEAFYVATNGLSAGTYNITIPTTWGKAIAGTYQFTLTNDVPIGGQLSGFETCADTVPANWKVKSWSSTTATSAIETVSVTSGSDGTALGGLIPAGNNGLNSIHRVGYGYNRNSQSAARQYLNSSKAKLNWWTSQNIYDRPPNELLTKNGFLTGFTDDFLSGVAKIKVTTALNTVTDSTIGATEDTYDKFFLPSLQQMFITPQLSDVEGSTWEYWKRASGRTSYAPWNTNMPNYVSYGMENHTSPQNVRLRSATRGNGSSAWNVNSRGYVYGTTSYNANRFAPACVIA